jgi:hypothetical protein
MLRHPPVLGRPVRLRWGLLMLRRSPVLGRPVTLILNPSSVVVVTLIPVIPVVGFTIFDIAIPADILPAMSSYV